MKDLPILFSGSMVNAIRRDVNPKTQTRRAVTLPPWLEKLDGDLSQAWPDKAFGVTPCLKVPARDGTVQRLRNKWDWSDTEPTRLWVREAWRAPVAWDDRPGSELPRQVSLHYEADGAPTEWTAGEGVRFGRYRHARFMPRWASRLTLDVTGVRVERLHDISDEDIAAEGVTAEVVETMVRTTPGALRKCGTLQHSRLAEPMYRWRIGWTLINGRESWERNDWLWVVEFRRAEQQARAA